MRLSTAADRDDERSVAVIHAALDAGARLLDTSDAYCHDESDIGHNERLIARALKSWRGDSSTIEVATKGGMRRPRGAWVADGKAKHLRAACAASLQALEIDVIDLYQLHAVDPRTPLETSVRALAALHAEGRVRHIGLCNVTVSQIRAARDIVDIHTVQVSLSVWNDENLRNGVAEYCRDEGIRLLAYRPLGGERASRLSRDDTLRDIAVRHGVTPPEIALAWLGDLGVMPIPGATRLETAQSIERVRGAQLDDDDRAALDARFSGHLLRVPRAQRRPATRTVGDVVLVMGMPAAGKSSVAQELLAQGYQRLNRDERGGTLSALARALDAGLAAGDRRWVLDNTYPTRKSRNEVIETAWAHGAAVRCVHLTTSVADAQINAIERMLRLHGGLPTPDQLHDLGKRDPRFFGPEAQFRYERSVELPAEDEGFESIDARKFVRHERPNSAMRALVLEFDDVFVGRASGGDGPVLDADDVMIAPGVAEVLQRFAADGWLLFSQAWRPQIARGQRSAQTVAACFARARQLCGADIAVAHCPHDAGPPICWCRKPLPGLILEFAIARGVALRRSVYVGRAAADRTTAQRLGMRYVESIHDVQS